MHRILRASVPLLAVAQAVLALQQVMAVLRSLVALVEVVVVCIPALTAVLVVLVLQSQWRQVAVVQPAQVVQALPLVRQGRLRAV